MIGHNDISVRLTLAEMCAAALMEAADGIESAQDTAALLDALDNNLRLWLVLRQVETKIGWAAAPTRDNDFAVVWSSNPGQSVADGNIAGLVSINRQAAEKLADTGNVGHTRIRIRLAYRESGCGGFIPWLLSRIDRRVSLLSMSIPSVERDADGAAIGAAALEDAPDGERFGVQASAGKQRTIGVRNVARPISGPRTLPIWS
jgi:hypothetical protein